MRSTMRRLHFNLIIKESGMTLEEIAQRLNIKPITLIAKINSARRFYESEIKELLKILDKPFEDVFKY